MEIDNKMFFFYMGTPQNLKTDLRSNGLREKKQLHGFKTLFIG